MSSLESLARTSRRGRGLAARNLSFVRGCDARVHRVNMHGHDRATDNRFYEQSGSAYVERERVADPQQSERRRVARRAADRSFENIRVQRDAF